MTGWQIRWLEDSWTQVVCIQTPGVTGVTCASCQSTWMQGFLTLNFSPFEMQPTSLPCLTAWEKLHYPQNPSFKNGNNSQICKDLLLTSSLSDSWSQEVVWGTSSSGIPHCLGARLGGVETSLLLVESKQRPHASDNFFISLMEECTQSCLQKQFCRTQKTLLYMP